MPSPAELAAAGRAPAAATRGGDAEGPRARRGRRGIDLPRLLGSYAGIRLRVEKVAGGAWHLALSSHLTRLNGMEASVYLVGRLLVDSGFVHALHPLRDWLAGQPIDAICLTHHHEDHSGCAGAIAQATSCPVLLREPARRWDEGLDALRAYRKLWWGEPPPYEPLPMPPMVSCPGHRLRQVPIPGHSATHSALFDESTGVVYAGDLFVTGGVTGVMSHECPFASIASLRSVASLAPTWMLTGHARAIEAPEAALRAKADAMEHAAGRALELHARGMDVDAIVQALFSRGRGKDRWMRWLTEGEFCRANFVRGCVTHASSGSRSSSVEGNPPTV